MTAINVESASRRELRPLRKGGHRRVDVHETHNYSACFSGCTMCRIVPKLEEKFTKHSAHYTDASKREMSLTVTTLTTLSYSRRWRPSIPNFIDIGLVTKYRSTTVFTTPNKVWVTLYSHHKTRASLNTFWNELSRDIPPTIDESLFGMQNLWGFSYRTRSRIPNVFAQLLISCKRMSSEYRPHPLPRMSSPICHSHWPSSLTAVQHAQNDLTTKSIGQ